MVEVTEITDGIMSRSWSTLFIHQNVCHMFVHRSSSEMKLLTSELVLGAYRNRPKLSRSQLEGRNQMDYHAL
jgi:hypothetical protein